MNFIQWFFDTPTPTLALVSAIVAILAYLYQRKEKRKINAQIIAEKYAKDIIKRMRFMKYVLVEIGYNKIANIFEEKMFAFDNSELSTILNKNNRTINTFEDLLKRVNKKILDINIVKSQILSQSRSIWYSEFDELDETSKHKFSVVVFRGFITDLLNELEAICILLRYNIADEKIIYQSLHQTFLEHFKFWYYFISIDNYQNENRYYDNLIWVYKKWNKRHNYIKKKNQDKNSFYFGKRL